jgi:hypothetical protein
MTGASRWRDHNTRIVVFGEDASTPQYVAEALAREAFPNVSYFAGTFQQARAALHPLTCAVPEQILLFC